MNVQVTCRRFLPRLVPHLAEYAEHQVHLGKTTSNGYSTLPEHSAGQISRAINLSLCLSALRGAYLRGQKQISPLPNNHAIAPSTPNNPRTVQHENSRAIASSRAFVSVTNNAQNPFLEGGHCGKRIYTVRVALLHQVGHGLEPVSKLTKGEGGGKQLRNQTNSEGDAKSAANVR